MAAAVVGAGLLLSCAGGSSGEGSPPTEDSGREDRAGTSDGAAPSSRRATPRLTPSECVDPSTPTASVTCEVLVLPEDRSRPDERQVELPVLRVAASATAESGSGSAGSAEAATAAAAAAGPVVYLHGGPGAGAVEGWISWTMLADGLGREVVTFDQRGGGAASPRLDCPEHDTAVLEVLGAAEDWSVERERIAAALAACRERLRKEGIDLDRYDTPTSVEDLEDLRLALGAERMSLIGVSYGSRLALDYVRTHPDRVSSLVLDGVDVPGGSGPEVERQLLGAAVERLVGACASDPACATAHPDLGGTIERLVRATDAAPLAVTLPAAPDGSRGAQPLLLTGSDLLAGLFSGMYDTAQIPLLPSVVERVAAGDTAVVELVLSRAAPNLLASAHGLALSVNCADLAIHDDVDERELAARSRVDPGDAATLVLTGTDSFCDVWEVEPVDTSFVEPMDGEDTPPTLIVAGELDPVTPAAGARDLAEELGATYVEVPRGGHVPLLTDGCARRVLRSFLVDASVPDVACAASMTPMPFT
ncbi:MAG: alpha/beta fold hydrolase [Microthrixaceae bacterium]